MKMDDILSKAEALNKQIQVIRSDRETREGSRKAYLQQLEAQCKEYEAAYGVSLWSEDLGELKKALQKESQKEFQQLEKEVALKEAVVAAFQSGDFDTMRSLLGVEVVESGGEDLPEAASQGTPAPAEVEMSPLKVDISALEPQLKDQEVRPDPQPLSFASVEEVVSEPEQVSKSKETKITNTGSDFSFGFDFDEDESEVEIPAVKEAPVKVTGELDFSLPEEEVDEGPFAKAPAGSETFDFGFDSLLKNSDLGN